MCWIHRWRIDIDTGYTLKWHIILKTCIKCHLHLQIEIYRFREYKKLSCKEYEKELKSLREQVRDEKIEERERKLKRKRQLKPKKNCKYGV